MNKLILTFFCLLISAIPVFAEKIPVKISPTQIISTHHDEVEVGDYITFKTVSDIFSDGKLILRNDSPVIGIVDFVHNNGWTGDCAEIRFKTFYLTNLENKKIQITCPLIIQGNNETKNATAQILANYVFGFIRGAEIYIVPNTKVFNIFITQ